MKMKERKNHRSVTGLSGVNVAVLPIRDTRLDNATILNMQFTYKPGTPLVIFWYIPKRPTI
jgi:hypothetical protein